MSRALDGYQAYKYNKEKKAKKKGKSTEVTKIYDSDLPEYKAQSASPLEAFKQERGLGTLTDAGRAAYANRAVRINPFDSMPNRTAGAQALWDLSQQGITQRKNVADPADRYKTLPASSLNQIGGLPGVVQQKRVEEYKASQAAPKGMGSFDDMAAAITADKEKREKAAKEALDMRPSYMKQQGQTPVPQNQLKAEDFRDADVYGSNMEGSRNTAKPYSEYFKDIKTGREDADKFAAGVEKGRRDTRNELDLTDAEQAQAALGGGQRAGAQETTAMLTDQEKQNYYYIAGTQGKNDAENYRQYVIQNRGLNEQIAKRNREAIAREMSYQTPTDRFLFESGTQFLLGAGGALENMSRVPAALTGDTSYRADSAGLHLSQEMVNAVDTSTLSGKAYRTWQQLMNTSGNNAVSIAGGVAFGPGVGSALFAAQAAGDAYQQVINQGGTVQQAQYFAAMQAIDEEVTNALLGGIAARGGGLLKDALGKTPLARTLQSAMKGMFVNNPVGLRIANGVLEALANGGSEALQEYTQYFSEKFEKWLATGEAPTFNVDGKPMTWNEIVEAKGSAAWDVFANPEALESALMGFLNAGMMNGIGSVGRTADAFQRGRNLSQDSYQTVLDMVDPNITHYRSEDTYRAGKEATKLARDQQRRVEAGRGNTLMSQYGRGLMAQAAQEYQRQAAENERNYDYFDEEKVRDHFNAQAEEESRKNRALHRLAFGGETAVDKLNRIRSELAGDTAEAAWEAPQEDHGVREVTIPAEMHEQYTQDMLNRGSADRLEWEADSGEMVSLQRENDGFYTFTNERGEEITLDPDEASDLLPSGQPITMYDNAGSNAVETAGASATPWAQNGTAAFSAAAQAPSTAAAAQTTAPPTARTTATPTVSQTSPNNAPSNGVAISQQGTAASGTDRLAQLADEAGKQTVEQREAQRNAIYEAGKNRDSDFQTIMDGATMLSEAEKTAAFNQGMQDSLNEVRMEGQNNGRTEEGNLVSGEGSGRNVSLRTGEQASGVQQAAGGTAEAGNGRGVLGEADRGSLGEGSGRVNAGRTGVASERNRGFRNREIVQNLERAADKEVRNATADMIEVGEVAPARDLLRTAVPGQTLIPVFGGKTYSLRKTDAMVRAYDKNIMLTPFISSGEIMVGGGESSRAFADPVRRQLGFRLNDEDATGIQLTKHELIEFGIMDGKISVEQAFDILSSEIPQRYIDAIVGEYFASSTKGMTLTPDQTENAFRHAMKEIVCDIGAGIDQISGRIKDEKARRLFEVVHERANKALTSYLNEKLNNAFEAEPEMPSRIVGDNQKIDISDGEISVDKIVPGITEMPAERVENSTSLYREPAQKELFTLSKDGEISIKEKLNMSGRDFLIKQMKEKGYRDKKNTLAWLDKTADFMDKAETVYTYIGLDDIRNTKLVIDPRSGNIVLRALVKNGEYPVNIDLTKECTRRIALGKFVDWLSRNAGRKGGKTMLEEVPLTASNLVLFNKILKDEGFDTACLGCFVETRRYRIQEWADSFIEKYNKAVEKNNPNAEYFNFADKNVYVSDLSKKDLADLNEALESYKANVKEERNAKKAFAKAEKERLKSIGATKKQIDDVKSELSNEEKINALVRSNKIYQKKLRVSDLITPGGRTVLHRDFPELESLVLGHYGSNTPKSVELFTPYNYDLGSIQAVGKQTLQEYVTPIAGAREQSFSDSVPTHLMDQMEKTADMAVNKLPDHIYTKVPSEVMLFGLTRRKFNMSIMFNIDPDVDSAHAGLRADGSYFVGDRKTSELEAKAGREKTFVQSFPYDMAKKIQHMPGYSKHCGMIGVGYSYFHIKKMLADPEFGYLIGYHPSGMNGELASASYIEKATSYEPVQNTLKIKGLRHVTGELNGLPSYASWPQGTKTTDNKMIEKTKFTMKDFDMKGNLKKYGGKETMRRFLAWLEENRLTVDTSKASYDGVEQHGVGSFPLYEDLAKTKDYRKTADNYITWCLENDMLPEFYEFADDDNYFNFIYDYTPYDHNTGKYSPQLPVQMNFPDNFFKLASHSLNQWNNYMMRQDPKEIPTFERMYNEAVQYSSKLGSGEIDMRSATESDEDSLQTKINSSMTMDQAKQMVQRAFNIGDIKAWFDGEYKNGDEWLAGEGSSAVALVIDNDYSLQQKYINKVQGILDDEFTIEDVLDAYSNQSLTGAVKEKKSYDVDLSKSAGYKDNRFYAPKAPAVTAETLNTANLRATAANKDQVNKARLDILIAAHNDANIADKLGITKTELNKKLRTWSRYSARAMSLAEKLNSGVALENQWSGLQNCSIISQMNVTDDDINSMVKSITGTSRGNERNYIAKTILAADTHIDWSWLNFEFKAGRAVEDSANVRGLFGNDNIIIGGNGYLNTVAHEMGHALSNKWASDLMGTEPGRGTDLADHLYNESYIKDPDAKRFAKHFEAFMDSLTDVNDIRSEYTNRPGEVFARFFAKFVEWTNKTAGNYFFSENEYYKDQFKPSQYTEFVKLLQEKAALDAKRAVAEKVSTPDVESAADDPNNTNVIRQGSEKDIQYSSRLFDKDIDDRLKVRMASFFSGGGTVDFALRNIVSHEFAVELNDKIAAIYRANNGDNIYIDDVTEVNIDPHKGRVEYFHASPVCTNFSGANNNAGEKPLDKKTAGAVAKAIKKLNPKVVTVENVAKYMDSDAVKIIEEALHDNGYIFDKAVYRATDFGGATIRERMFLRAVKENEGVLPPIKRTNDGKNWYSVAEEFIDDLPEMPLSNYMKERLKPSGIDIKNLKQPVLILGGNKGEKLTYAYADKPSPTILANSSEARIIMPNGKVLRAVPRVLARIQGLPKEYNLGLKDDYDMQKSWGGVTRAYTIVGNGVPVELTQGIVGPLLEENLIKQKSEATGIQYSSKLQGEIDEQYDEALRNNDMDAAAKLVKEAAEKAGYKLSVYHGTGEHFNVFNMGGEGIHLGNRQQAEQVAKTRFENRSKTSMYAWEKIRNRVPEMNREQRDSLVRAAYLLGDYFEAGVDEYPFDGNIMDNAAVTAYVDHMVDAYKKGNGSDNDVTLRMRTFDRETNENVMELYAKINNPMVVNGDIVSWTPSEIADVIYARNAGFDKYDLWFKEDLVDISGSEFTLSENDIKNLEAIRRKNNDEGWSILRDLLARQGYDGIQYKNEYEGDKNSWSYLALSPSDVKSADTITYDDNGKVIPLSERFNPEDDDIRYSSKLQMPEGLTEKQQKNFQYNESKTETGDALRTLHNGSRIGRSKYGVGKNMAKQFYVHKDYAEDIVPKNELKFARDILADEYPDFKYNCIMYDPSRDMVRFDEAPDFDTAREPMTGDFVSVNVETGDAKKGHSNYIWHHKWQWVKNDYKGFDVRESWEWSKEWLNTLMESADGNGIGRWNAQLDKYGLPHDGDVQYSSKLKNGQKQTGEDTSVLQIPGTFTHFEFPAGTRILDYGGGQFNLAKDAVEKTYPGVTVEIMDAFNRTSKHNDRIGDMFDRNKADAVTVNNVLNVIDSKDARHEVIEQAKRYLKKDGVAYFLNYQADKNAESGEVKGSQKDESRRNYQTNMEQRAYIPEIKEVFKYCTEVKSGGDIYLLASNIPLTKDMYKLSDQNSEEVKYLRSIKGNKEEKAKYNVLSQRYGEATVEILDSEYENAANKVLKDGSVGDAGTIKKIVDHLAVREGLDKKTVRDLYKVKRDADGNVIPLSQRVEIHDENIRYSSKLSKEDYAPTFYSKLQREVQNFKGEKIGTASVESYLKGKGVKDEEIKWSGIRQFLEGKKSVSKAELMDYLKANEFEIEEHVLSGTYDLNNYDTYYAALDDLHYDAEQAIKERGLDISPDAIEIDEDNTVWEAYYLDEDGNRNVLATRDTKGTRWYEYKLDGGENYREVLFKIPGSDYSNRAMKIHWEEEGVLAHARVQDFESSDGGRVLFVEEIQSDWHNAGQKEGYRGDKVKSSSDLKDAEKAYKEKGTPLIQKISKILTEEYGIADRYADTRARRMVEGNESLDRMRKSFDEEMDLPFSDKSSNTRMSDELYDTIKEAREYAKPYLKAVEEQRKQKLNGGLVPDAPFRTNYTDYVLKNLLRMAAEGDYDYLAWTTGKMQEARWSDQYAEGYRIEYDQEIPKYLKKYGKQWKAGLTEIGLPYASGSGAAEREDINELLGIVNDYERDIDYQMILDGLGYQSLEKDTADLIDEDDERYERAIELARNIDEAFKNGEISSVTVPAIVVNDAMKESVLTEGQPMYSSKNTGEIDEKALDPRRVFISYNPDLQNAVREISDVLTAYQELAPTQAEIKRTTRQIAKKFGSHINVDLAARKMETLYNFLAGGGKPDGREVLEISMDIANDILDEATHNDPEIENRWKKFKQEMRKRWIYVPKDRVRDLNPDGIKALRKQWKGKMVFTTDEKYRERYGQIHYIELQQMFPEYFTKNADNMNDIEAIEEIMFAFDAQAPIYEQIYTGATRDEAALEIAYDIMQGYFGNDRAKDRFKKIYRDYVKPIKDRAIDEYRDKLRSIELKDAAAVEQRTVFDQIKGMKGSYVVNEKALKDVDYQGRQAMMERLREKAEQDKKRYEEQIEKVKAGYVERSQKDRLMRLAKELRAMKGGPEFEAKKKELIGDLDLIAKGISYNYERKLMDMKEEYERLAEEDENFEPDRATIKKIERLQKKQINQMTAYEITALTEAILKMKQDQWTHNRMIRETDAALVADEGRKIVNETNALKGTKGMNRLADAIDGYSLAHLNSKRAFRKMSGYNDKSGLMKLWNELNEGQHKTMDFRRRAVSPFDAFMSEEENKDFITGMFDPTVEITSSKIEIEDENGNIIRTHEPQTVKITPAMKISIYLHSLNQDNREHARYGGFRIPNMDKYERRDYSNAYGQGSKIVRLTKADMQSIASTMTPQELRFADLAHEYFNKTSKDAINEASMLLNGYELASVDNYMPIKTDPNFTKKDISGLIQDGTIEGQGWTKDRNFMAKNPILLEDITQVLQRSIDGAALYYGLAIPVRNFNKVYEFQRSGYTDSVKEAIMQTFGKRGNEYIEKLLRDLQGGNMYTKDAAGKWVDKFTSGLRGNYAQAILTLNPSVAIKQAASYPTAAARLGFEPLKKALAKLPTSTSEDMDLINKYTPLLWYRAQGQSSDALAEVSKRKDAWEYKGGVEKTRQMFNWIQNIDVKTVKTLWYASEYYVQDNMPGLKEGTEAYYREVAKVFNEVVEDTQPNYTTMQRASISRVDNEIMKAVFMFKTQPLQNVGILYDSIMEYQAKQEAFKQAVNNGFEGDALNEYAADMAFARQGMMRSVASITVSTLVFSAMTQLAKLLLHRVDPLRDEGTGELTKASILKNFFGNAAESVAGMLAGAGEIYSLIMAMTTGSYLDNLSVSGIDSLNDTMTKMLKTYQNIGKIMADEETSNKEKVAASIVASRDLAIQIMDLTGIPANNAKKIAEALINHYHDVINPIFTPKKVDWNLESGARITDKQYANRALKYYQKGNIVKGDAAAAKIEKASAMQSALGAKGKKDEDGNSIANSKKYDAIHRILRTPGPEEAKGKMFAAAYPSDELARYMYGGGSAYDFMVGQMLAEEIAALSKDEREKKLYSFVEETGYTLEQKKAWLVSDKDRIESKTLTAWRDANGTDWDYIKHMSNLEKFNGSKEKKAKVVAYIKRQTTDTKKRKALFLMAGYQLDSKEDGKTVKDGNFKKAMGN